MMLAPPLTRRERRRLPDASAAAYRAIGLGANLGLSFLAASVGAESAVAWKVLPDASWERAKSGWLAGRVLSVAACSLGT